VFLNIFEAEYRYMDSSARYRRNRGHLFKSKHTLELQSKRKTAIISSKFSFHIISIVAYICSFSDPSNSFSKCCSFWIYKRFHSYIVKWIRFEQIDYIEAIFYIFSGIGNGKEIPLCVSVGVVVGGQYQIILKLGSKLIIVVLLNNSAEIAAFETGLKY